MTIYNYTVLLQTAGLAIYLPIPLCLDTDKLKRMNTLDSLAQVPCESCSGIPKALRKWNIRSHAGGSTVTPSQVANSAHY